MSDLISRRSFAVRSASLALGSAVAANAGAEPPKAEAPKAEVPKAATPKAAAGPTEAPFERDYPAPSFKPSWRKAQINRVLVQDFVILAHSEPEMVKKLLEREPGLLNAAMDWGGGDWETALGGASHMGRRDIVEFLLGRGARIDIFCAAMMGRLDAVKSFLALQPTLIDAKGPHGFSLHFHAQVGGKDAENVLDYLQSVKKLDLKPNPFLKKATTPPAGPK